MSRIFNNRDYDGLHFDYSKDWRDLYKPWQPAETDVIAGFFSNKDLEDYLSSPTAFTNIQMTPEPPDLPFYEKVYIQEDKLCFLPCENHWFRLRKQWDDVLLDFAWYTEEYNAQIQSIDGKQVVASVADFASLPSPIGYDEAICLVINENWYYSTSGTIWSKAFFNAEPLKLGNGQKKIISRLSPALMDTIGMDWDGHPEYISESRRLPAFKNVKEFVSGEDDGAQEASDMPCVLAFARGAYPSSTYSGDAPYDYGYGTSDEYGPDAVDTYQLSLMWHGPKGLFEQFWKEWSNALIGGEEVECLLNLSYTDLVNLDLTRPVYIDGRVMLFRELEIELPLNGPVKARLHMKP